MQYGGFAHGVARMGTAFLFDAKVFAVSLSEAAAPTEELAWWGGSFPTIAGELFGDQAAGQVEVG